MLFDSNRFIERENICKRAILWAASLLNTILRFYVDYWNNYLYACLSCFCLCFASIARNFSAFLRGILEMLDYLNARGAPIVVFRDSSFCKSGKHTCCERHLLNHRANNCIFALPIGSC